MLRQGAKEGQGKAGKVQRWTGVTKARVWVTHPVVQNTVPGVQCQGRALA